MPAPYDARRFRTTVAITIPAGTLVVPKPDGSGHALSPDGEIEVRLLSANDAERRGLLRQLATGEA